jgi:hypothetical protein
MDAILLVIADCRLAIAHWKKAYGPFSIGNRQSTIGNCRTLGFSDSGAVLNAVSAHAKSSILFSRERFLVGLSFSGKNGKFGAKRR